MCLSARMLVLNPSVVVVKNRSEMSVTYNLHSLHTYFGDEDE